MTSPRRPKGRNALERFLFSFMGPPQLGDPGAPVTLPPAPPGGDCPTCRAPYDAHEIVRSPRLTYTRCPDGSRDASSAQ